jgi:outer membrane autotransporter protein
VLDAENTAGTVEVYAGGLLVGGTASRKTAELSAGGVHVYDTALLGGHGTVKSDVFIYSGGVLSPGNSYGTTTINGNLFFQPGALFDVEVNPYDTGEGDGTIVTGTAALAGTVRHVGTGGTADDYAAPGKEWLILDAAALSGAFDGAVSDLAFLLPQLRYDRIAADVFLSFTKGSAFSDYADTGNRRSLAGALESLDPNSGLYREITGTTTRNQAGRLMDELSGEMHSTVHSGLFLLDRDFERMISRHISRSALHGVGMARSVAPAEGTASDPDHVASAPRSPFLVGSSLWVTMGGTYSDLRGNGNAGRLTLAGPEVSGGYDARLVNGWLGGLAFQYGYKDLEVSNRRSEADINSYTLGLYGGKEFLLGPGALRFVLSGAYARHEIDGTRKVRIGDRDQALESEYAADSLQGSLEGAYMLPIAETLSLEPFARIGLNSLHFEGFGESGGNAALKKGAKTWNHAVSAMGLRIALPADERVKFSTEFGWQHTYGNVTPSGTYAFREGGDSFTVQGAPLNRDEALIGLNLGLIISENVSFHLIYDGALGDRGQTHGGKAMLEVKW